MLVKPVFGISRSFVGVARGFRQFFRRRPRFRGGICWLFTDCDERSSGNTSLRCVPSSLPTVGHMVFVRGSLHQIAWQLLDFATNLAASRVDHVVISQLIRHKNWRELSAAERAARMVMGNEVIRAECQQCHQVSFWKHKGFMYSQGPIFRTDGVHFNDLGSYKLFRSYSGAILLSGYFSQTVCDTLLWRVMCYLPSCQYCHL